MRKSSFLCLLFIFFFNVDVFGNENISFITFSSDNRFQESTTDFDENDDIRNFTSEALFSESELRLNRELTKDELKQIIRTKPQFETFNTLSLNFNTSFGIDISYKYRNIDNAQITNFFSPNQFNDVNLNEYGFALRTSTSSSEYDAYIRGTYKHTKREGVIEFFPDSKESIDHYEVNAAISKHFNSSTLTIYPTYVFQDIRQNIPSPYERNRHIVAIPFTYGKRDSINLQELVRPISAIENIFERQFDMRKTDLFGGIIYDNEKYGNTNVTKFDYFIGTSIPVGVLDVVIQPNIFTSKAEGDKSQDNSQYRTNISTYYQINNNLLFIIPFRNDVAIGGPNDFENWKIGLELRYSDISNKKSHINFFTSLRYDYQSFFHLNKKLNLYAAYLTIEF